jgi:hypothetical protein
MDIRPATKDANLSRFSSTRNVVPPLLNLHEFHPVRPYSCPIKNKCEPEVEVPENNALLRLGHPRAGRVAPTGAFAGMKIAIIAA